MHKNILYITFVDFTNQKSGSAVRPKKIYDAFLKSGYNVELLTGLQNRKFERWKNVWNYYKKIKSNQYDFCYIEPPAGPIFNLCDHMLMKYISKKKKIPMGLFYRDAYWKFADWYSEKGIKRFIINTMHKFDWHIIKSTCNRVYFPTITMADLFDFQDKEALPPACEDIVVNNQELKDIELIYVGGMSEEYGGELLLQALNKVNESKRVNLHLVCREEDSNKLEGYKDKEWLNIYHASGEKLKEIYSKANIAIIPRKVDFYMDFAMPVKLFEYISYELPIISTQCKEVANFIQHNNIGEICLDNVESLSECVLNLTVEKIDAYRDIVKDVKKNNTWINRVEQISKLKSFNEK